MKRAIIYLRISTIRQNRSGIGLQSQLALCRHYAERLKIKHKLFFQDIGSPCCLDIQSRHGLSTALLELKKGDVFVVASRDRITHNPSMANRIERLIQRRSARLVVACPERRDPLKSFLVDEKKENKTKQPLACSDDVQIKAANLTEVKRTKFLLRNGIACVCKIQHGQNLPRNDCQEKKCATVFARSTPYGYQRTPNGMLEINAAEYEVVQLIHWLHEQGYSLRSMVYTINYLRYRNRAGNQFQLTQIARIKKRFLNNE